MPKWTQNADEYSQIEKIMLVTRPSQYLKITLKDRRELLGWLVSSSWGTDAVINHTRGLGPIAKSMWGELRLLTGGDSRTTNIDAMEVESVQEVPVPTAS